MWNTKVKISAALLLVAILFTNILEDLFFLIPSERANSLATSPLVFFIVAAFYLVPYLLVIGFSVYVAKDAREKSEKGGWLSIIVIVLSIWLVAGQIYPVLKAYSNYEQKTDGTFNEFLTKGGELGIAQSKGRDSAKALDAGFLQTFVDLYKTKNGVYPRDRSEIEASYSVIWSNTNTINWDHLTYVSLDNNKSYVIRTQFEADHLNILKRPEDSDKVFESLSCDDAELYYCLTPQ